MCVRAVALVSRFPNLCVSPAMAGEMDRALAAAEEEEEAEVAAEVAEEEDEAEEAAEEEEEEAEQEAAAPAVAGAGVGGGAAGAVGGGVAPVPLGGAAAVLHAAACMAAPFDAIAAMKAETAENTRRNKRLSKDRTARVVALCVAARARRLVGLV